MQVYIIFQYLFHRDINSSGTWTPQLYDYNTYLRDLEPSRYVKIGQFVFAWINMNNPDLSGINTMMQIRNLPMASALSGSIYIGGLAGNGGQCTVQFASAVFMRPNITSAQLANPLQPGAFNLCVFGIS